MKQRRPHLAVLLAAMSLVAVACGARLDPAVRDAFVRGQGGTTGGVAAGTTGAAVTDPSGTSTGGTTTTGGPIGGTGTVGTVGGTTGSVGASCSSGGATDVGVTADKITIASVANISGIQPGLFKSAHQAMDAVVKFINDQGGICGRTVEVLKMDDKTESVGNRSATLEACKKAFALVGSMSAFDDGGADVVDKCGIPDMTAISVNPPRMFAKNTYAIYPNRPDLILGGPANYLHRTNPGVRRNAAMLYLNAGVTRVNALQRVKAYEKIGWDFVYTQPIELVETNYTPHVLAMKNHDPPIKYVSMVSDYQSIVRLLKAMRQQDWYPEVVDWDSVVYAPGFISLGGEAIAHSLFFINTAMIEEVASNPEMQLYQQYLAQTSPGAQMDYFGLYAWSAGRLFQKLATGIGGDLTRAKLFAALKGTRSWDGNGLHASHDIGRHVASTCFLYAKIEGGRFVRVAPKSGWMCDEGPLVKVSV